MELASLRVDALADLSPPPDACCAAAIWGWPAGVTTRSEAKPKATAGNRD
jgi:hypothetical protein